MRLRARAAAKLNLALELLGRRPDGFHEVRSVVQCVGLYDVLEAEPAADVSVTAPAGIGPIDQNLVKLAAEALRPFAGKGRGAALHLTKRIPAGAGLGGGSSDAASTLRLLAVLWRVPNAATVLSSIAPRLGSDVPLFLAGPAVAVAGRGEIVEPLPALHGGWFVIVAPSWELHQKTVQVYRAVRPSDFTSGERAALIADQLRTGTSLDGLLLSNGLQPAVERVFPDLARLRQDLERDTDQRFMVTGAGPALFAALADRAQATACAADARGAGRRVYVVRPLRRRTAVLRTSSSKSPRRLAARFR